MIKIISLPECGLMSVCFRYIKSNKIVTILFLKDGIGSTGSSVYWILQVYTEVGNTSVSGDHKMVVIEISGAKRVVVYGFNYSGKRYVMNSCFVLVEPTIMIVTAAITEYTVLVSAQDL